MKYFYVLVDENLLPVIESTGVAFSHVSILSIKSKLKDAMVYAVGHCGEMDRWKMKDEIGRMLSGSDVLNWFVSEAGFDMMIADGGMYRAFGFIRNFSDKCVVVSSEDCQLERFFNGIGGIKKLSVEDFEV